MGAELTVDHFLPRTRGGKDDPDNLVYCCHACNEFKGDYWQSEQDLCLLHPLFDDPSRYYREQEAGILVALSGRGSNHLQILRFNRPELVAYRLEQKEITVLRQQNQALRQQLQEAWQTTFRLEIELEHDIVE